VNRSEDLVRLLDGENHLGEVETGHRLRKRILLDEEREEIYDSEREGVTRKRIKRGGTGEGKKGR
jgi:hypothetical protein